MTAEAAPHPERVTSMEDWLASTRALLGKFDEMIHATIQQVDARLAVLRLSSQPAFRKIVDEAVEVAAEPVERDDRDVIDARLSELIRP
jgi:hypothetical protein